MLRSELDRLLDAHRPSETAPAGLAGRTDSRVAKPVPTTADTLDSLADRYREALSRSRSGDDAESDEAYEAVMQLVRSGPAAFPALRDAYLATNDPRIRAVMARAFGIGLGPQAAEFVAAQLGVEGDADVRTELLERASSMSTPTTVPVFRDAFLQIVESNADAEAKVAALRGLRYLRDDRDIDRALVAAARDASEDVRIAAIEDLASRPALRSEVEGVIENDPSRRVRQIGECRLLLTGSPSSL